eukprot:4124686-Pleurochrysis_carterae.AAC.1
MYGYIVDWLQADEKTTRKAPARLDYSQPSDALPTAASKIKFVCLIYCEALKPPFCTLKDALKCDR